MSETASKLTNRVALVTGASSGIGQAISQQLAAAGVKVVAAARRLERLEALREAHAELITPLPVDLREPASIHALFAAIQERHGGVDILVNNAGLGYETPLIGGNESMWREMLEVNVLALSICTSLAVQSMRARGDKGHIVHVSSMAAHRVPPGSGMYSASKYAVRSLTEGLRQELRASGSQIRIGSISPGYVETEFHARFYQSEERAEAAYRQFPVIQPQDIASLVLQILEAPPHVQVHDILLRPTLQQS